MHGMWIVIRFDGDFGREYTPYPTPEYWTLGLSLLLLFALLVVSPIVFIKKYCYGNDRGHRISALVDLSQPSRIVAHAGYTLGIMS